MRAGPGTGRWNSGTHPPGSTGEADKNAAVTRKNVEATQRKCRQGAGHARCRRRSWASRRRRRRHPSPSPCPSAPHQPGRRCNSRTPFARRRQPVGFEKRRIEGLGGGADPEQPNRRNRKRASQSSGPTGRDGRCRSSSVSSASSSTSSPSPSSALTTHVGGACTLAIPLAPRLRSAKDAPVCRAGVSALPAAQSTQLTSSRTSHVGLRPKLHPWPSSSTPTQPASTRAAFCDARRASSWCALHASAQRQRAGGR